MSERREGLYRKATLAQTHITLYLNSGQERDLERAIEILEDGLRDEEEEGSEDR